MLDGGVDGAAAFGHVADDDPQDAVVIVGIHEDLDVQLVPEFLAGEDEDAFHNDHISFQSMASGWSKLMFFRSSTGTWLESL